MTSVVIAFISLGAIDFLDPQGISTLILLLPLVRKDWHALVMVWVSYLTYWLVAVLAYYGVLIQLKRLFDFIENLHLVSISLVQLSVGCIALIGAVVFAIRLIRNWSKMDGDVSKVLFIKSVHPFFIAFYGIILVLMNIPIFWPLYSFIAILISRHFEPVYVILMLGAFTLFSMIPQFAVYWFYRRLEAGRFASIMGKVKKVLTRMMLIAVPVFLLFVGLWLVRSGLLKLLFTG